MLSSMLPFIGQGSFILHFSSPQIWLMVLAIVMVPLTVLESEAFLRHLHTMETAQI